MRQVGAEGIVSKRRGSIYRGGESRDWLKTKCHETGVFAITGFSELGEGRLEAIYVAEEREGVLHPAGQVRFGFAGKGLWHELNRLRAEPSRKGFVPVRPGLLATVKYFGRYKAGFIRDEWCYGFTRCDNAGLRGHGRCRDGLRDHSVGSASRPNVLGTGKCLRSTLLRSVSGPGRTQPWVRPL